MRISSKVRKYNLQLFSITYRKKIEMKNKSVSIPMAMITKKFFCHKCGERLIRNARTRTIKRGDPDFKEHSRVGRSHLIGDVELTEYDFKCPACGKIIRYEEQCVIGKIQKQLRKKILSDEEVINNREKAEDSMDKNANIFKVIIYLVALSVIGLILYSQIKSGDFSFTFYF